MIAYLKGNLIHKQAPVIIINVNGVGYELLVPMSAYYQLGELGSNVEIFCYNYVREDANLLYGFNNLEERKLFIELLKTNGVGPRLALTILSNYQVAEFINIINNCEVDKLVKLPGVGKKTADRLLLELRDKLKNIFNNLVKANYNKSNNLALDHNSNNNTVMDAISALEVLGYKSADAKRVVNKFINSENKQYIVDYTSEELIKAALKEFS